MVIEKQFESILYVGYENRDFPMLIQSWLKRCFNDDKDRFLRETFLSELLTMDELDGILFNKIKIHAKKIHAIAAIIPQDIATYTVCKNKSNNFIKEYSQNIADDKIEAKLSAFREKHLTYIVENHTNITIKEQSKESLNFISLLEKKFSDTFLKTHEKYKKDFNFDKIISHLSKSLHITEQQFYGYEEMKNPEGAALDLATILDLEEKEADIYTDLATTCWLEANNRKNEFLYGETSFARCMKFLRHTEGKRQRDLGVYFSPIEKNLYVSINNDFPKWKRIFYLSDRSLNMLKKASLCSKDLVKENNRRKFNPLIEEFHEYGLTFEKFFKMCFMQTNLYDKKPKTIIHNIKTLYEYFKEKGLTTEKCIQASIKKPALPTQKPETMIRNIETVYDNFKNKGLKIEVFLEAAVKNPQLFYQNPKTIIKHIEILFVSYHQYALNNEEKVTNAEILQKILDRPMVISFSTEHLFFRRLMCSIIKPLYISNISDTKKNVGTIVSNYLQKLPEECSWQIELFQDAARDAGIKLER